MNKKEAYKEGYERGWNVASWIDVPELGASIPMDIDWVGYDKVDADNFIDVMEMLAANAESNSRQYSPFEETAHEMSECHNSDSLWNAFDEGISAGIRAEIKSRKLKNFYKNEGK